MNSFENNLCLRKDQHTNKTYIRSSIIKASCALNDRCSNDMCFLYSDGACIYFGKDFKELANGEGVDLANSTLAIQSTKSKI